MNRHPVLASGPFLALAAILAIAPVGGFAAIPITAAIAGAALIHCVSILQIRRPPELPEPAAPAQRFPRVAG